MKFSSKIKFKLNKLGKNSSNSCNQQMSPYYIHIVTYKLGGSQVFLLYDLCFIYRFYSVNFYISYATKVSISIKLDISKAYNCVEWVFLREIILKLGLDERWAQLAMATVQAATYSMLINGVPQGYTSPSRGIKQGDPLSPYLFLLCVEDLFFLIRKATERQQLHGILSCTNRVCISHLLFADDSFIFCQATIEEWRHLLEILERYEAALGQAINSQKTSVTTQGKALATSALYLKRTSHNRDSLQLLIKLRSTQ